MWVEVEARVEVRYSNKLYEGHNKLKESHSQEDQRLKVLNHCTDRWTKIIQICLYKINGATYPNKINYVNTLKNRKSNYNKQSHLVVIASSVMKILLVMDLRVVRGAGILNVTTVATGNSVKVSGLQ